VTLPQRLGSKRARVCLLALACLVCAGTSFAGGIWLPENYSTLGERIDHLYRVIFVITAVIFVVTEGILVYFVIRYRARPGQRVDPVHDHNVLEVVWSVIPALILVFLALYQWNVWADAKLRPPAGADVVRVEIFARQFEWHIRYAGADGEFATADDVTTINQLHIPVGKPILAQVRAQDVIHSFWLPNFRVKQDIVPGTTMQVWWDALQTGTYEIACAELCGLGHYRMRGQLFVHPSEEFNTWLQEKQAAGVAPADWGWNWDEGT
jgi:cytochrome c oxidase subunit 2